MADEPDMRRPERLRRPSPLATAAPLPPRCSAAAERPGGADAAVDDRLAAEGAAESDRGRPAGAEEPGPDEEESHARASPRTRSAVVWARDRAAAEAGRDARSCVRRRRETCGARKKIWHRCRRRSNAEKSACARDLVLLRERLEQKCSNRGAADSLRGLIQHSWSTTSTTTRRAASVASPARILFLFDDVDIVRGASARRRRHARRAQRTRTSAAFSMLTGELSASSRASG